jgi:hypothetical protein
LLFLTLPLQTLALLLAHPARLIQLGSSFLGFLKGNSAKSRNRALLTALVLSPRENAILFAKNNFRTPDHLFLSK